MLSILLILVSTLVMAEEPAPDRRAQLCTEIQNFFRSTPQPNWELLLDYVQGRNRSLTGVLPPRGRSPSMYRRMLRDKNSPTFQDTCLSLLPAEGPQMSVGGATVNLVTTGSATRGEILRMYKDIRPVSARGSLSGDYCTEYNDCRAMQAQDVEQQGRALCLISQSASGSSPTSSSPSVSRAGTQMSGQCQCLIDLQRAQCRRVDEAETLQNLRTAVLRNVGQNFLNLYAQLREDTQYYQTRATRVPSMNVPAFNCSEFQGFQNKVRSKCGSNADTEQRMQTILNSFTNLQEGSAASMFAQTNNQILRQSGPHGILRSTVDYSRNAFTMRPEMRAIERMVQDCLKGNDFFEVRGWDREVINRQDGDPPPIPLEKVAAYLKKKAFESPQAFIERYVKRESLGDNYQAFIDYITTPSNRDDESAGSNIFLGKMTQLVDGHPGFDMLLSNDDFARSIPSKNIGDNLRAWLESPESGIDRRFRDRCSKIQDDFADLVCSTDRQLQDQIGTNELREIVTDNSDLGEDFDLQSVDRLRCENRGQMATQSAGIFAHLRKVAANSDYYDRFTATNPSSVMTAVSDAIETNDPEYAANMRRGIANSGGSIPLYNASSDPGAASFFNEFPEFSSGAEGRTQARTLRETSSSEKSVEDSKLPNPNDPASLQKQNQAASLASLPLILPSAATATAAAGNESEAKKALRESLAKGDQQESVNRLVSNLDDDAAGELARLRQELSQSQQNRISELNSRADRLQRQLRDSEQERNRLQDQADSSARNQAAAALNRGPASVPLRDSFDAAPVRGNAQRGVTPQNQQQQNLSQQAGPASVSGSTGDVSSGARLSPGRSASGSGNAITVARYEPLSAGGPVTVEAQSSSSGNGGSSQEDLNRNIRKYLEQSNLDLETLIQIKESGMLYRYRVNERGQSVQREMLVSYSNLDEQLRQLIDQKILSSRATPAQIERISSDIRLRKRNYSYETLRAIIVGSANGTL